MQRPSRDRETQRIDIGSSASRRSCSRWRSGVCRKVLREARDLPRNSLQQDASSLNKSRMCAWIISRWWIRSRSSQSNMSHARAWWPLRPTWVQPASLIMSFCDRNHPRRHRRPRLCRRGVLCRGFQSKANDTRKGRRGYAEGANKFSSVQCSPSRPSRLFFSPLAVKSFSPASVFPTQSGSRKQ